MQVLLAQQDSPGLFQAADNFCILRGDAVFEQCTGRSGADPGSVDEVFQPKGDAVQRSSPVAIFSFGLARLSQGGVCGDGDEGIEGGIESLDACQASSR